MARPNTDETLVSTDSIAGSSADYGGLTLGKRVGGYLVIERISGRVDEAAVYSAYDPRADRKVALRLIHPVVAAHEESEAAAARVARQVEALRTIRHPNVAAVLDHGTILGVVYVITEFIPGQTLRAWLDADEAPSLAARIACIRGLAAGLHAGHEAGVLHLDVRPETVLVTDEGQPVLVGLGLSRIARAGHNQAAASIRVRRVAAQDTSADSLSQPLVRDGERIGVPAYLAPEQYAGVPLDPGADQFSTCVTAYELVYGERPFAGRTIKARMLAIEEGRVRDPRRGPAGKVPAWLRAVLIRGLQHEVEARWPSLDAFVEALDAGLTRPRLMAAGLAVGATVLAAVAALLAPSAASTNPASPSNPASNLAANPGAALPPELETLTASVRADEDLRSAEASLSLARGLELEQALPWYALAASFADDDPALVAEIALAHAGALTQLERHAEAREHVRAALDDLAPDAPARASLEAWLAEHPDAHPDAATPP